MPVQQLRQVPLGNVAAVRHRLEGQLFRVVFLDVGHGLIDDEASRAVLLLLRFFLLMPQLGLGIQACGHGHKRFLDLIHFGGLQQKPGDTQTNCLLGIGKVLIAGQHRHLHVRELTAQRRQHGQAVGSGHADVGEQDMGLQFPDQRRAFLGAAGRSHDLAAVVRPLDDPPQAFHNDIFIVNENYPIHRIRSFFFLPGHAAPA